MTTYSPFSGPGPEVGYDPAQSLPERTQALLAAFDGEDKGYGFDDMGDGTMYATWFAALLREWETAAGQISGLHADCGSGYGYCDDGGHGYEDGGCATLVMITGRYDPDR